MQPRPRPGRPRHFSSSPSRYSRSPRRWAEAPVPAPPAPGTGANFPKWRRRAKARPEPLRRGRRPAPDPAPAHGPQPRSGEPRARRRCPRAALTDPQHLLPAEGQARRGAQQHEEEPPAAAAAATRGRSPGPPRAEGARHPQFMPGPRCGARAATPGGAGCAPPLRAARPWRGGSAPAARAPAAASALRCAARGSRRPAALAPRRHREGGTGREGEAPPAGRGGSGDERDGRHTLGGGRGHRGTGGAVLLLPVTVGPVLRCDKNRGRDRDRGRDRHKNRTKLELLPAPCASHSRRVPPARLEASPLLFSPCCQPCMSCCFLILSGFESLLEGQSLERRHITPFCTSRRGIIES